MVLLAVRFVVGSICCGMDGPYSFMYPEDERARAQPFAFTCTCDNKLELESVWLKVKVSCGQLTLYSAASVDV